MLLLLHVVTATCCYCYMLLLLQVVTATCCYCYMLLLLHVVTATCCYCYRLLLLHVVTATCCYCYMLLLLHVVTATCCYCYMLLLLHVVTATCCYCYMLLLLHVVTATCCYCYRLLLLQVVTVTCSKVVPLKNEGADYCRRYFHCSAQKENKVLVAIHGRHDGRQPVHDDGNNEPTTDTTNIQRKQRTYKAQVGIAHLEKTSAGDVIPTAEYINSSTLNLNLQHKLTTYIVRYRHIAQCDISCKIQNRADSSQHKMFIYFSVKTYIILYLCWFLVDVLICRPTFFIYNVVSQCHETVIDVKRVMSGIM